MVNSEKPFVITGCGRSGTTYVSTLLKACGIRCGHEEVFHPRTRVPQWGQLMGDSSWLAVPHLHGIRQEGHVVYHQVRNPLEVLRSLLGFHFFSMPFTHPSHGPYLRTILNYDPAVFAFDDPLRRAMTWWIRWNIAAEASSHSTYRVEDLDVDLVKKISGVSMEASVVEEALRRVSRRTNGRLRDETLTWKRIPRGPVGRQLRALAERYGYAVQ